MLSGGLCTSAGRLTACQLARPYRSCGALKRLASIAVLAVLLPAGCSTPPPATKVRLEPIGPRLAGPSRGREGFLRVHSATTDEQSGQIPYKVHTPYWVYTESGEKLRSIPNHVGVADQAPMTIRLPPGRYLVLARADGLGLITAPVVIAGGMMTEVHLTHTGMEVPAGVAEAELVRLPTGKVAGYRVRESVKTRTAPAGKP